MARNGSGTYSLPGGNPVVTGTTISSTVHNTTMSDIATAITASLAKDGQTVLTGPLDFNGVELILDADGDTTFHASTDDQIDIRVAGADDFTITPNALTALSGSSILTDTISETTSANGVVIDSVTLKDGGITASADVTGLTFAATGDTAAGDNASMGYTAAEGLILTGQGSTSDVTIKNDADTTVLSIATGTTTVAMAGAVTVAGAAVVGSATVVSGYDAAVVGAGSTDVLIGSTDASGVTLVLDGNSNGDGSGGDYAYIQHVSTGLGFNVPGTQTLKLQVGGTSEMTMDATTTTIATNDLVVTAGVVIITTPTTPASAAATGTIGTIAWDTGFLYICTGTDTWKRVAIATW